MSQNIVSQPIWLNSDDVKNCLSVADCIAAQEEAFILHYRGHVKVPARPTIKVHEHVGELVIMPAYLGDLRALGLKALTWYPKNPATLRLPSITALVILFEAETGQPLAIMDATMMTALRTAGGSAAATRVLARPDAQVLGVLGSGPQAECHILALSEVRALKQVKIYSPTGSHRESLAARLTHQLELLITPVSSAKAAVEGADIVVTATSVTEPVVKYEWLAPGCHINCIGSGDPHARELDSATLIAAKKVVVDSLESALAEAGDILIPIKQGEYSVHNLYGELGAVLAGDLPGREQRDEITIFKSVGVAFQDVAAAWKTYLHARQHGVGLKLS